MSWYAVHETLIQNGLILALLGYSIQLAARSGALSLAGVGFFGIGGFGAGNLLQQHWATTAAVVAVVAGSAVLGLALSLVFAQIRGLYFAMGTLAFTLFAQTLASTWPKYTGGENGIFGIPLVMTTGGLALMVGIVLVYAFVTELGAHGRKLRLLEEDEVLAASLGVRIRRERAIALVLSAICGAAAGAGQSLTFGYFSPSQMSFALTTNAVIVMVIGGTRSWFGPVVGAFVLAWLPTWLEPAGDWRGVVQGLIAVVIIVVVPGGVVGTVVDLVRRAKDFVSGRRHSSAEPPDTPSSERAPVTNLLERQA
jgi:branched-chain amino acid transport system permease protein